MANNEGIIIRPIPITQEMLVSSNAPEFYPLWDAGQTARGFETSYYARNENTGQPQPSSIVRSALNNQLYESLVGTGWDSGLCSISASDPAVVTTATPHGLKGLDVVVFPGKPQFPSDPWPASVELGRPYLVKVLSDTTFNLYIWLDLNTEDLVDTSGDTPSGLWTYTNYDLNTGYWGDPGGNYAPMYAWETQPRWLDIGPNNTWAMFDGYNGTQTVNSAGVDVTIQSNKIVNAIGFHDLEGSELTVQVYDGATLRYEQTFNLVDNSVVVDYYTFFFGERRRLSDMVIEGLPEDILAPKIRVFGPTAIGNMVIGQSYEIGAFTYGMTVGQVSYSVWETNEFGNYRRVYRRPVKKAQGTAIISNDRIDGIRTVLGEYDATPIFWKLTDGYSSTVIYGPYREFEIEIAHACQSIVSLEVEAVT